MKPLALTPAPPSPRHHVTSSDVSRWLKGSAARAALLVQAIDEAVELGRLIGVGVSEATSPTSADQSEERTLDLRLKPIWVVGKTSKSSAVHRTRWRWRYHGLEKRPRPVEFSWRRNREAPDRLGWALRTIQQRLPIPREKLRHSIHLPTGGDRFVQQALVQILQPL
jgi:hypothetical protein